MMARDLHTSPEAVGWEEEDFTHNRTPQGVIPNEVGEGRAHILARTARKPNYA